MTESEIPEGLARMLEGMRKQREPLSRLTLEELEQVRGKVLAVSADTGELLWSANSIEELEASEPENFEGEWEMVAGPNPKPDRPR